MSRSAVRADLRDATVLAGTELRVRLRSMRGSTRRLLATTLSTLFFVVAVPLMFYGPTTRYGQQLAGDPVPIGATGVALGTVGLAGLYLGGASGFSQESAGSVGPLVRTSIPPRAVALGRLCSEVSLSLAVVVLAGLVLLVEVAIGAGRLAPVGFLAVGAVPFALGSFAWGRVLGTGVRQLNRRLGVSLWTRAIAYLLVAIVGYVLVYQFVLSGLEGSGDPASVIPPAMLPGRPLQAYAGVVLAPLGARLRPLGLLVATATLAAIPVGVGLAVRLESRLLLDDHGGSPADDATSRGVPRPFRYTPSGRVAWRYLLRTRRDPRMLAHLAPLLFGVLGMVGTSLRDPGLLLSLGQPAAVVTGGILAGGAYCLNPLGDDRDQFPLLFTSAPSTAVLLRGRVLAGLALALPIAVGGGFALGVASGTSIASVSAASVFAVGFSLAGAGTALGVGAVVPRFDRREYMSVERAHPSTMALLGFFFGGLVVGAIGLFLVVATVDGGQPLLSLVGWAVYLGVVGVVAGGGYAYAVRRFDELTLDEV